MMETNYSHGIERDAKKIAENDLDHRKWSNPLEVRLPKAPSMSIYCVRTFLFLRVLLIACFNRSTAMAKLVAHKEVDLCR